VRVVLLGLAWLVGWWLLWRVRTVPTLSELAAEDLPASVVIPARNEERMLGVLLGALARQTVAPREVIVVDDESSDGTAEVATAAGATVVRGAPLPAGWIGKPWAIAQGVRAAHHDVVVLLDADVEPAPDLIERLTRVLAQRGGLVSVQPYHRVQRWWEHASAFFNLVAVMGAGLASPRPTRKQPPKKQLAVAFGPVLVSRRDAFLEHVQHPSVRGAVLDDVALARRFAAAGESITLYAGREVVDFRMYDRPLDLVQGWTKNFAAGAGTTPLVRLVLIVAWVTACLVSGWGAVSGTWVAFACFAAFAAQVLVMLRQVGSFGPVTAILYPVLATAFVALFAASLALIARGSVRWKGRTVRLRGS